MKKIMIIVMSLFATLTLIAQQPRGLRPLPNQFRDFLDHQQGLDRQRPQIEKKDGKVIITMSEEQFKRMQQMRAAQRYRLANHRPQLTCSKCKRHHGKPRRKHI
jgi:hypothetical protein